MYSWLKKVHVFTNKLYLQFVQYFYPLEGWTFASYLASSIFTSILTSFPAEKRDATTPIFRSVDDVFKLIHIVRFPQSVYCSCVILVNNSVWWIEDYLGYYFKAFLCITLHASNFILNLSDVLLGFHGA